MMDTMKNSLARPPQAGWVFWVVWVVAGIAGWYTSAFLGQIVFIVFFGFEPVLEGSLMFSNPVFRALDGLIVGVSIGVFQALVLRRYLPNYGTNGFFLKRADGWILATALGESLASLILLPAYISSLAIGILQTRVLRRHISDPLVNLWWLVLPVSFWLTVRFINWVFNFVDPSPLIVLLIRFPIPALSGIALVWLLKQPNPVE